MLPAAVFVWYTSNTCTWHAELKINSFIGVLSMGWCKKDVTPVHLQWSCGFLALTHRYWSLGAKVIQKRNFQTHFMNWYHGRFRKIVVRQMPRNSTDDKSIIVLGDGLVPSGNNPLPEPMLTQIWVAIWPHRLGHHELGLVYYMSVNVIPYSWPSICLTVTLNMSMLLDLVYKQCRIHLTITSASCWHAQ